MRKGCRKDVGSSLRTAFSRPPSTLTNSRPCILVNPNIQQHICIFPPRRTRVLNPYCVDFGHPQRTPQNRQFPPKTKLKPCIHTPSQNMSAFETFFQLELRLNAIRRKLGVPQGVLGCVLINIKPTICGHAEPVLTIIDVGPWRAS